MIFVGALAVPNPDKPEPKSSQKSWIQKKSSQQQLIQSRLCRGTKFIFNRDAMGQRKREVTGAFWPRGRPQGGRESTSSYSVHGVGARRIAYFATLGLRLLTEEKGSPSHRSAALSTGGADMPAYDHFKPPLRAGVYR